MDEKKKKQNWKRVEIGARDVRIFRTIVEQKFVRRDHVIQYIFHGSQSYAEIRIRKLKKFDHLTAVGVLVGDPECYLLGKESVKVFSKVKPPGHPADYQYPKPQSSIELASYEHDYKVTVVRLIFENLGLCADWKSEKLLKAGRKGDRKVPDGIFSRRGIGMAVELELTAKKARTYRQIFGFYEQHPQIKYVFYVCGSLGLLKEIMELVKRYYGEKDEKSPAREYCFMLYRDLVDFGENVWIWTPFRGKFQLGHLIFGKSFHGGQHAD